MRIEVNEAVHRINSGEVVALPTETVYGLAASISNPQAIASVFKLKGRPQDNPLIVHGSGFDQIKDYLQESSQGLLELAARYWPGPLTLIAKAKQIIPEIVRAGLPTVAVRVPYHPLVLEVLCKTGPLVMPSANISGRPSATRPEHVEADFGDIFPVLDGGPCTLGIESTILNFDGKIWSIARQGYYTAEDFISTLGYPPLTTSPKKQPICPGQHYQHYSPKAHLYLSEKQSCKDVIGFSSRTYQKGTILHPLALVENPIEAAHNLYTVLRKLDELEIKEAWVDLHFPQEGLWMTLQERLRKAASTFQP